MPSDGRIGASLIVTEQKSEERVTLSRAPTQLALSGCAAAAARPAG